MKIIKILIIALLVSISFVHCDSEPEPIIKILGQVYFSLPQISDQDYSVVPQIVLSGLPLVVNPIRPNEPPVRQAPPSARFVAKQKADYFVTQAADTNHQATRYNFIKGKNIFTPSYIKSQVLEQPEEGPRQSKDLVSLSKTLKEEFNKNFEELKEIEKRGQTSKQQKLSVQKVSENPAPNAEIHSDKSSQASPQQISEDKSSEIYNEFKNIEALKEKNLREDVKISADEEKFQNLQKLVGYIIIGLVISFAILKRATKSPQTTLPKTTPERTELRLRDTADDQDDDDQDDSDDSNE